MANIVELRELDNAKLNQMLEDAREGLFKLRFRRASAQLEDYTQIKETRREIAQLETVLNMRRQAIGVAEKEPAIAEALKGKSWQASARFDYEESAYLIQFSNENGSNLATAVVDLNKKKAKGRRSYRAHPKSNQVMNFEVVG